MSNIQIVTDIERFIPPGNDEVIFDFLKQSLAAAARRQGKGKSTGKDRGELTT